ncbi:MAG: hypothetical protein CVV59_00275, partial [Tenericutes bacterium HGW-Tenericutes-4]
MSQLCDSCKVQLEDTVSHCPLCGKCVRVIEKTTHEHFPSDEVFKNKKEKALRATTLLLLLVNAICLFVDLIMFKTLSWSLHILAASTFAYIGVIRPIHQNWRLVNYHSIFYIMITLYIIFLENYTNSFGWGITFAIP